MAWIDGSMRNERARATRGALALAWLACVAGLCLPAAAQSIYTCVDGQGRRITADRPIAECMDRTQRELSRTGSVRREIGPVLTARERAAQEEKNKLAELALAREAEDKHRDRALLLRYPNLAAHEYERATALALADDNLQATGKRSAELAAQRKALDSELEFYVKDPGKTPAALKRRLEDHEREMAAQDKRLAEQAQEKNRVSQRFGYERERLKRLWAQRP